MSIAAMAGTAVSSYAAGAYTRSHVSETSEATITAGAARNKRSFVRAAHKRDRAAGRSEVRKAAQDWFASMDAELVHEAQQLLATSLAEMQHQEYLEELEYERLWQEDMAAELDREEYGFADTDRGLATTMTLEEAFTEGLRVTTRPSGYTYGRSKTPAEQAIEDRKALASL